MLNVNVMTNEVDSDVLLSKPTDFDNSAVNIQKKKKHKK